MASVDFYFDLSCPYSFMVSLQINKICSNHNVVPKWHPFLLSDQAPKPYSSATNKMKYEKRLLLFYAQRVLDDRVFHHRLYRKIDMLNEMVYLASINKDESNESFVKITSELFHSIWTGNESSEWCKIRDNLNVFKSSSKYQKSHEYLLSITRSAANKYDIFTTPSIVVNGHLFCGIERLPNVEAMLNTKTNLLPPARVRRGVDPNRSGNMMEFYFDFSSPWAFLGYMRLTELRGFVDRIIFKPILLGALFRDIGTPNAPALAVSNRERKYGSGELEIFSNVAGVRLKFNTHFPIRTVLPLRVFILENRTIDCIYRGAWLWNVNIGDEKALCDLLVDHGFDGPGLISKAKSDAAVKRQLRDNTQWARDKGMFGVPSYVINGQYQRFIWGQDKLDMVKDLCCGWNPYVNLDSSSKL